MYNPLKDPKIVAGIVVGGTVGAAGGLMLTGQQLEEQGAPLSQQFTGSVGAGLKTGLIGTGIGGAGVGTAMALKKILGK